MKHTSLDGKGFSSKLFAINNTQKSNGKNGTCVIYEKKTQTEYVLKLGNMKNRPKKDIET